MPSIALDQNQNPISSFDVKIERYQKRPIFTCPECHKRMVFMDCEKKINHFRHHKLADCEYETEAETPEHYYAKILVEKIFRHFATLTDEKILYRKEYPIIDEKLHIAKYADVYFEMPQVGRKVAVEVQYTNYDIKKFRQKILFYASRNITVVYLFFGENFQKKLNSNKNIYLLKDIEKELFYKNRLPVHGAYLSYDANKIPYAEIPVFTPKYKKGYSLPSFAMSDEIFFESSHCETRFIKDFNPTIYRLKDWLLLLCFEYSYKPPDKNLCKHSQSEFVLNEGKIKRYKEVCKICTKVLRWVPNKEAIFAGHELQ